MDYLQQKNVLGVLKLGLEHLVEKIRDGEIVYHGASDFDKQDLDAEDVEGPQSSPVEALDSTLNSKEEMKEELTGEEEEDGDVADAFPSRWMSYDSIINAPEKPYSFAESSFDPLAFLANELRLIKEVEVEPKA